MITLPRNPKKSVCECPACNKSGSHKRFIFQGIHTSEEFVCDACGDTYIIDLPIGHSYDYSFEYNVSKNFATSNRPGAISWFVKPYHRALQNPNPIKLSISHISNHPVTKPLVLNCLDYLYGHSLLKVFNIERHLNNHSEYDLVVIVPKWLQWLVPNDVAEIIVVDIKPKQSLEYFPELDRHIQNYLSQFSKVSLSRAFAHPQVSDISLYTNQKSCVDSKRITFVWRNDRPWFFNIYIAFALKKLRLVGILNTWQQLKIIWLFWRLRRRFPEYTYTVAGIGTGLPLPSWIEDERVSNVTETKEKHLCKIYAESKLVIGVHGSSMLLPSAHAEMMLNLVPADRLGNFAQDVIYETKRHQEARVSAFMFRYAFLNTSFDSILKTVRSMLSAHQEAKRMFTTTVTHSKK